MAGGSARRLENFMTKHKMRFEAEALAQIESNFNEISLKREPLRRMFRKTIANIRGTFQELRELKTISDEQT
jgi:hypothetical protein